VILSGDDKMAFNPSKARSPRAWAKVRASGGVGTAATAKPAQRAPRIVPVEELRRAARIQRIPSLELNSKFLKEKPLFGKRLTKNPNRTNFEIKNYPKKIYYSKPTKIVSSNLLTSSKISTKARGTLSRPLTQREMQMLREMRLKAQPKK
jgi:hypothetical protein